MLPGLSLQLLLTQAGVVMEESQEVAALLPVVAACCAGAPGSHVGCGVVEVVGSDCASCRRGGRERETARICMFKSHTGLNQLNLTSSSQK